MAAIYHLLQGSYGYILIFQIIVVTGLFVFFLWMMAQRSKSAYLGNTIDAGAVAAGAAASGVTPSEWQQLKEKCAKLEEENAKATALKEEYEGLLQKVKFLESKLLEYEILQEEIGTLSSLKVENEKLKSELQVLQREIASSKGAPITPPIIPPMPAPGAETAPPPAPEGIADLPTSVPNMDFSTANPTPAEVSVGAEATAEALPDVAPPPIAADDGLEGLLKQIDSLTQPAAGAAPPAPPADAPPAEPPKT